MIVDLLNQNIVETDDIEKDIKHIEQSSKEYAERHVNIALVARNWMIGKRIASELKKKNREETYGKELVKRLSLSLHSSLGKGFDQTNLYYYFRFYNSYPDIFYAVSKKSILSWTHYRLLLGVSDQKARDWYENEAYNEKWSARTLQRNIETQYYYRLLKSSDKSPVVNEMHEKTLEYQNDKYEFVKNPYILEFLNLSNNPSLTEKPLESAILDNLQKFLLELGKGYAFVARQKRIHTEKEDYFIDLVFFNYYLNCFVLIDLKTSRINHQDVGQMDMYVRMYDELQKIPGQNPTLGILLCSETDMDIARYSLLKDNDHIFASKYKLYLPSEAELRNEIEAQKEIFNAQSEESK